MESNIVNREESHKTKAAVTPTTDDAVGVPKSQEKDMHWYIAIVGNNAEKKCLGYLTARLEQLKESDRNYEVYLPTQKVLRIKSNGQRHYAERILFPALIFIRCTNHTRLKEIAPLPYIHRFFINTAGKGENGHRPVAIIPDDQMESLRKMALGAETPISIESHVFHLGERVRVIAGNLVGLEGNICREPDNSTSLVVKMDVLGCAKVSIPQDLLQPLVEDKRQR